MENEKEINSNSYNLILKKERLKRNLSYRQFSKVLNINHFIYKLIEEGYLKPTKKQITKISKSLNLDFNIYMNGKNSYPDYQITEKPIKFLKKLESKRAFRIILIALLIINLAFTIISLSYNNYLQDHFRDKLPNEYITLFDYVADNGTTTFSLTGDLSKSEIYYNDKNTGTFTHIVCSKNKTKVTDIKFESSYYNSNNQITFKVDMSSIDDKHTYINAVYVDFDNYNKYQVQINAFYDNNKNIKYELVNHALNPDTEEIDEDVENILISKVPSFNEDISNLINDNLESEYDFYNDIFFASKDARLKYSKETGSLLIGYLLSIALVCLLIIFIADSYIYDSKNNIRFFGAQHIEDEIIDKKSKKLDLPDDIKIFPPVPEFVIWFIGTVLMAFGSFRIILKALYIVTGSVTIESYALMDQYLVYFMIGLFLIFFLKFDIFFIDKRSIRNIVTYSVLFVVLTVILMQIQAGIDEISVGHLFMKTKKFVLPNYFGSITMYFLIMFFLFTTPKNANSKIKLLIFRLLSLIPVLIIIFTTIASYSIRYYRYDVPLLLQYLVNAQRPQISALCILYLYSLFFLRLYYKYKYGCENAKKFFNGNRYFFIKNIILVAIVLIIGNIEMILNTNTLANAFGIGMFEDFMYLAPLLLLYHPHLGERNAKFDLGQSIFYFIIVFFGYFIILGLIILAFFTN